MSEALRALRKLVLGETWTIPLGVALVLGAVGALTAVPGFSGYGALVLLAGLLVVLAVTVRRSG